MSESKTQRVALIGWPVEHSVSPAMHNAAFAALGLDWHYELMPTPPAQVAAALAALKAGNYRGANVTVPHKEAVLPYLDDVTVSAREIGAVNTIVQRDGRWIGLNTDDQGFIMALRAAGVRPAGIWAAVLGAGGGARAVVSGLIAEGAERIHLLNRSVARAEALAYDLDCRDGGPPRLRVLPLDDATVVESAHAADLLVNATPIGMWPAVDASPWPEGVPLPADLAVFDLVYNPQETRLLRQARESGARPIGGLEMLVQQGVLAFLTWTGQYPPLRAMRFAAQHALAQREENP
jgi:shikimate dehydrogenase